MDIHKKCMCELNIKELDKFIEKNIKKPEWQSFRLTKWIVIILYV